MTITHLRAHAGRRRFRIFFHVLAVACALLGTAIAVTPTGTAAASPPAPSPRTQWVGAWASAPSGPTYPLALNQSFRTVVRPTAAGDSLRLVLSNQYGDGPVEFRSVSVARRATGPAIQPDSTRPVTFGGALEITAQPGNQVISDPVLLPVEFGEDLAISFHVPTPARRVTGSGISAFNRTAYESPPGSGDYTHDTGGAGFAITNTFVPFLTRIDVNSPITRGTVVAFGDSVTEGTATAPDSHADYPARLAARLHAESIPVSVINTGIGGNTLLPCGAAESVFGPPAVERFRRDVLSVPHVTTVIITEGGNDLRYCGRTAIDLEKALQQLIDTAHAAGLKVLLGTYIPRVSRTVLLPDAMPDFLGDDQRQILNAWIRDRGDVTVVDFDRAVANPAGTHQQPRTESMDGIHPGPRGYQLMADTVPVTELSP